jgi:hypothetical protein
MAHGVDASRLVLFLLADVAVLIIAVVWLYGREGKRSTKR